MDTLSTTPLRPGHPDYEGDPLENLPNVLGEVDGLHCPYCDSDDVTEYLYAAEYKCHTCGEIFEED